MLRKRKNLFKFKGKKMDNRDKYQKHIDSTDPDYEKIKSQIDDDWFLSPEDHKKRTFQHEDQIARYPHGWRHYETLLNYKTKYPDANMQEYVQEMHR
jgi:hypothetical protein